MPDCSKFSSRKLHPSSMFRYVPMPVVSRMHRLSQKENEVAIFAYLPPVQLVGDETRLMQVWLPLDFGEPKDLYFLTSSKQISPFRALEKYVIEASLFRSKYLERKSG